MLVATSLEPDEPWIGTGRRRRAAWPIPPRPRRKLAREDGVAEPRDVADYAIDHALLDRRRRPSLRVPRRVHDRVVSLLEDLRDDRPAQVVVVVKPPPERMPRPNERSLPRVREDLAHEHVMLASYLARSDEKTAIGKPSLDTRDPRPALVRSDHATGSTPQRRASTQRFPQKIILGPFRPAELRFQPNGRTEGDGVACVLPHCAQRCSNVSASLVIVIRPSSSASASTPRTPSRRRTGPSPDGAENGTYRSSTDVGDANDRADAPSCTPSRADPNGVPSSGNDASSSRGSRVRHPSPPARS